MFLTLNCCFHLKHESSVHNILNIIVQCFVTFSNEKVVSSESGEKYAQIKLHLQVKTVLSKYVDGYMSMDIDVRGQ